MVIRGHQRFPQGVGPQPGDLGTPVGVVGGFLVPHNVRPAQATGMYKHCLNILWQDKIASKDLISSKRLDIIPNRNYLWTNTALKQVFL